MPKLSKSGKYIFVGYVEFYQVLNHFDKNTPEKNKPLRTNLDKYHT